MLIGDIESERAKACRDRLVALGAPAISFHGSAATTVSQMVDAVPQGSLCLAYVDPYNLELLSFSILQELARLKKVDLAINFCTMDLKRNVEVEFDRARFDGTAPGWQNDPSVLSYSKQNTKLAFFSYWRSLVQSFGFTDSKEMPLVHNNQGHDIYRMVFFARDKFPTKIWEDVARGPNRELDLFGD